MNSRHLSKTAQIVSAARAIGVSRSERDALAASLWTGATWRTLGLFERDSAWVRGARLALRAASLGLIDHNTVRMLLIDDYIRSWVQVGCSQLVILGAGLDLRPWRLEELTAIRVFEVDRYDNQRWKSQRVAKLPHLSTRHEYVPVDLEREELAAPLYAAGLDRATPTAWICEGVTPYLTLATIEHLWRQIATTTSAGTWAAFSYITPATQPRAAVSRGIVGPLVAKLGEPAKGAIPPDEMRRLVELAGLRVVEDLGWHDWTRRLGRRLHLPNLLKERLIVGVKGVLA